MIASLLMQCFLAPAASALAVLLLVSCTPPPPPSPHVPGPMAKQIVAERLSAVVVTNRSEIQSWAKGRFEVSKAPGDADGGSAAPITEDGYFLTADHVLDRSDGRNVFIIYARGGRLMTSKSRIVWRSQNSDLALLHIPEKTPYFYNWTPPNRWLSPGHGVIHGGMATGFRSAPGRLRAALKPEGIMTGNRRFKIDIPLRPGDSGGPVVDALGHLVGINSAVEFLIPLETAIFIDSEGNRPSTRQLGRIIQRDRMQRGR